MIEKYIISKDDKYYRAFTDLIKIDNRLICVFSEMNKDTKESNICYSESLDNGITWSDRVIFQTKFDDNGRWDSTRLSKSNDGSIIMLSTWYLNDDKSKKNSYIYVLALANKIIKEMLNILVIDIPSVM